MKLKKSKIIWLVISLAITACQGQMRFSWGNLSGDLNLCSPFPQMAGCRQGETKLLQESSVLLKRFEQEIHPVLTASCSDCHQVGKLKGDAPLADYNKSIAFSAALTRFLVIESQITANHQSGQWSKDLQTGKEQFIPLLQQYQSEMCVANPGIPICISSQQELKTAIVDVTGPLTEAFQYIRFNISNLVYPSGLPAGGSPVFAELGIRNVNNLVAFGEFRVFNSNGDLTVLDVSVEHNTNDAARITRRFAERNIGVPRATTAILPALPNPLSGPALTGFISAPVLASDITPPSSPLKVALKFQGFLQRLPSNNNRTARQKFDEGVVPILQISCMGCHNQTRNTYTMFPINLDDRYRNSKDRIVPRNFANSLFIRKGTLNGVTHGGGNAFNFAGNRNNEIIVRDWIDSEQ